MSATKNFWSTFLAIIAAVAITAAAIACFNNWVAAQHALEQAQLNHQVYLESVYGTGTASWNASFAKEDPDAVKKEIERQRKLEKQP